MTVSEQETAFQQSSSAGIELASGKNAHEFPPRHTGNSRDRDDDGSPVSCSEHEMLLVGGEREDTMSPRSLTITGREWKVRSLAGALGLGAFLVFIGAIALFKYSSYEDEIEYLDQMPTLPTYPPPVLPSRAHTFSIDEYGAVGDGKNVNTDAFRGAMEAAGAVSGQGGATVLVPAGRWLTGPFALRSDVTLLLATGAIILATTSHKDYTMMDEYPSYCAPGAFPIFQPFISGVNLSNIAITGNGTIDGQGRPWWAWHEPDPTLPRPPRLIELENCDGIIISGITLKDSPFWTLHPIYSRNIHIHGLTIRAAKESKNTDGINPDSCEIVLIENCTISTGDDSIAIKSGRDTLGQALARPSRYITVRGCTIGPSTHGVSIGSELSGGVSDVAVHDIVFLGGQNGIRIKTVPGRGGYVTNIRYENVWARHVKHGFLVTAKYRETGHNVHPCDAPFNVSTLTLIEDIKLTNYTCLGCKQGVGLFGFESRPLYVRLYNISLINCHQPWSCSSVSGEVEGATPESCHALKRRKHH